MKRLQDAGRLRRTAVRLCVEERGSILIEAALSLSILIALLLGLVSYGVWMMSAHSLQQVANEAARATLGSFDAAERQMLVDRTIAAGLLKDTLVQSEKVTVSTQLAGDYFTVTLSYDASANPILATSLLPVPTDTIVRSATVELITP